MVAGRMKGRVLLCDAYLNQTAGIRGDSGMWLSFAAMLFCLPLARRGSSGRCWGGSSPACPSSTRRWAGAWR